MKIREKEGKRGLLVFMYCSVKGDEHLMAILTNSLTSDYTPQNPKERKPIFHSSSSLEFENEALVCARYS